MPGARTSGPWPDASLGRLRALPGARRPTRAGAERPGLLGSQGRGRGGLELVEEKYGQNIVYMYK